jgi:outer membrane protein assembly factor BamB
MYALAVLLVSALIPPASDAWPQWGGPSRNFVVQTPPLATSWPDGGPRRLWQRPLGDGFSAIVSDGATLYTIYRDGTRDVAIALDAKTGLTSWETRSEAPFVETCSQRLGPAPRAAPLIDGPRLVTISSGGLMQAFDRASGRQLWQRDLYEGKADAVRPCGYSASPLSYKGTVITTVGGKGRGVMAVDGATGKIAWQSQDFENGYSSPILIDLDGRPELVVFTAGEVAGLDPDTGALEWSHPHPADYGVNVATPIWSAGTLFVSSAYNGGSRMLKLSRKGKDGKVAVEELWATKRVRVHFGNAVRLGSRVYASNGDFGAAPLAAIDAATGDMIWRDRGVARSTLVGAGDRLVILDEDGNLAIATPGDSGLTIHAKAQVLAERAWTVPTLVGTVLYVRDQARIMALELGT